MKQNKKNLILGGILVLLLFMVYTSRKIDKSKSNNFLSNVNTENITKLVITNGKASSTTLIKDGEKWKIDGTKGFYTKDSVAKDLNEKIPEMINAKFDLISTNGSRKDSFRTDGVTGVKVEMYDKDNKIDSFIIGKIGPDFTSTYISKNGIDKTFLIKDLNVSSLFNRTKWMDDEIFNSDKEKITKIRFQYPDREFIIEKNEIKEAGDKKTESKAEWKGTAPYKFSVDQGKVGKILNVMSNLSAIKIPVQKFDGTGLEKHLIIVQATGEDIDNTLMVGTGDGSEGEELYYVKKGDSDNIYLITKEQRDILNETIAGLK